PANQKPCEKMAEAIVMDGGKRGQVVKVCADPACRVHHPDTPSPQQVERERAEERKRIEKEILAITTRHRILATVLQRVSAPLKKADLLRQPKRKGSLPPGSTCNVSSHVPGARPSVTSYQARRN